MRKLNRLVLLAVVLIFIASLFLVSPDQNQGLKRAYVEPGLYSQSGDRLSVIISGVDSERAAWAVTSNGGQVTSELWLINAVAATIPSDQLETLAAHPEINSIVSNKQVTTADESNGNGWVTNRRAKTKLPAPTIVILGIWASFLHPGSVILLSIPYALPVVPNTSR